MSITLRLSSEFIMHSGGIGNRWTGSEAAAVKGIIADERRRLQCIRWPCPCADEGGRELPRAGALCYAAAMLAATVHTDAAPAVVLAIFALTYLGIAVGRVPGLKLDRTGIALLGAIALMIFAGVSTSDVIGYVNWPTILLLFGFFVLSAQLRLSGFFDRVAASISGGLGHPARFLLVLMSVTAGLSAFLNHDIVCFVFAPIVATALLGRRINPVPFLIALAIASNIGAAATLVGNPQDMMLAQVAHLSFGSYMLWSMTPVLFAFGCAYGLIWMLSRHRLGLAAPPAEEKPSATLPFDRPHTVKGLVILVIVVALFFTRIPKEIIALTAAGVHLASPKFRTHDLLALVDWPILVLFAGLFVVTGAFQSTGYGEDAVRRLAQAGVNLNSLPVLALATAALSNLLNNSAAVLLLVKVTNVSHPAVAYVLALANSFGGSLIIIGSVSNIIVVQQARELGVEVSFREFARLGVPVTAAVMAGLIGWVALVA
jgi:Na+/H+ antiporter NhaD/arsenite permease-like protein